MHVEGVLANNDYILNGCYIEITSNCNLRCIHCYNESGELRDQISVEAFKNVLVRILAAAITIIPNVR